MPKNNDKLDLKYNVMIEKRMVVQRRLHIFNSFVLKLRNEFLKNFEIVYDKNGMCRDETIRQLRYCIDLSVLTNAMKKAILFS